MVSVLAILGVVGSGLGLAFSMPPVQEMWRQLTFSIAPNVIPTPEALVELRYRGLITEAEFKDFMRRNGYSEEWSEKLYKRYEDLLTVSELITAYWRGVIDERRLYEEAGKRGVTRERLNILLKIAKYYPSPSDFIRFAVREVFNPVIVQKYGYDEEFPTDIIPHVKKVGMEPEILKWYWRAHWELPSPTQLYEMFQRLHPEVLKVLGEKYKEMGLDPEQIKVDLNTLREALKTADYPRYWRDRLIAISYYPLTRVDLRRIYQLGLIDDKELVARLMELGYTKKDAEKLAEFYRQYKIRTERDLTRSNIIKLYKIGEINRETAKQYLLKLKYDDKEAELLLAMADYELAEEQLEEKIATLSLQYQTGAITYEQFFTELDKLGLPPDRRDRIILLAEERRKRRTRFSTLRDLRSWFIRGIIDEDTARKELELRNYRPEDIERYINDWKQAKLWYQKATKGGE